MPGKNWSDAVLEAVQRLVARTGSAVFTRQALIEAEMSAIIAATGSGALLPTRRSAVNCKNCAIWGSSSSSIMEPIAGSATQSHLLS